VIRRLCHRLIETSSLVSLAGARVRCRALRHFLEDRGGGMGRHSHAYYEAVIFLEGTARLLSEETILTTGAVLVHSPQRLHAWEPITPVNRLVLSFDVVPAVALPSPLFPDDALTIVNDLVRALLEVEGQRPEWEIRTRSLMTLVCSSLLASGTPIRNRRAGLEDMPDNLATEVDQYLRDNLAHPVRLSDIASHLGMSERTLTLHYHRLTGDSIIARLRRIRLEVAQSLLISTSYTLAEVGQRVGIPDASYFGRCYKQQFGHSPGRHRR